MYSAPRTTRIPSDEFEDVYKEFLKFRDAHRIDIRGAGANASRIQVMGYIANEISRRLSGEERLSTDYAELKRKYHQLENDHKELSEKHASLAREHFDEHKKTLDELCKAKSGRFSTEIAYENLLEIHEKLLLDMKKGEFMTETQNDYELRIVPEAQKPTTATLADDDDGEEIPQASSCKNIMDSVYRDTEAILESQMSLDNKALAQLEKKLNQETFLRVSLVKKLDALERKLADQDEESEAPMIGYSSPSFDYLQGQVDTYRELVRELLGKM